MASDTLTTAQDLLALHVMHDRAEATRVAAISELARISASKDQALVFLKTNLKSNECVVVGDKVVVGGGMRVVEIFTIVRQAAR